VGDKPSHRGRVIPLLVGLIIGASAFAAVALANTINCGGGVCYGSNNDDTMNGTGGFDDMRGDGGGDLEFGEDHYDELHGQAGGDVMFENANGDTAGVLEGGDGDDYKTCYDNGDPFNCGLMGEGGWDLGEADSGTDYLKGGIGSDSMYGESGGDDIVVWDDNFGHDFAAGGGGGTDYDNCYLDEGDSYDDCEVTHTH
jgi:hypothetical protein